MTIRYDGKVAIVTGSGQGLGRSHAIELAKRGAKVVINDLGGAKDGTGGSSEAALSVVAEIEALGGEAIANGANVAKYDEVEAMVKQTMDKWGRVDILVNNATSLHDDLVNSGPFWDKPLALTELWNVGMRSHYVASWFAAPLLQANGEGLVVNTSSFGGRIYMHGPAYGAGKAGLDKMSHDMAIDFRPFNVAVVSVWMGLLLTERSLRVFEADPDKYADLMATAETPVFTGRIIDALLVIRNAWIKVDRYGLVRNWHKNMGSPIFLARHRLHTGPFLGRPRPLGTR